MGWLKTILTVFHGSQSFSEAFFYVLTPDPSFGSAFHSAFDFAFDFAVGTTFKMTKHIGMGFT